MIQLGTQEEEYQGEKKAIVQNLAWMGVPNRTGCLF